MHSKLQRGSLSMPSLGEQQEIERKTKNLFQNENPKPQSDKLPYLPFARLGIGEDQQVFQNGTQHNQRTNCFASRTTRVKLDT